MRLNRNYLISSFFPSIPFNFLIPLILLLIIFNDTNSSVFPNRLLSDNIILKAQLRFKRGAVLLDEVRPKLYEPLLICIPLFRVHFLDLVSQGIGEGNCINLYFTPNYFNLSTKLTKFTQKILDFQLPLQQNESPNMDIPRSKRGD